MGVTCEYHRVVVLLFCFFLVIVAERSSGNSRQLQLECGNLWRSFHNQPRHVRIQGTEGIRWACGHNLAFAGLIMIAKDCVLTKSHVCTTSVLT